MTRKEAIELLLSKGITVIAVYGQYDFNGREYCRIEGFKDSNTADDVRDYINRNQNNYSWCRLYSPEQAVRMRNNIGCDYSSNISDSWTATPVGLEFMRV